MLDDILGGANTGPSSNAGSSGEGSLLDILDPSAPATQQPASGLDLLDEMSPAAGSGIRMTSTYVKTPFKPVVPKT